MGKPLVNSNQTQNPNTVKLGIPMGPAAFVGGDGVRSEMKCRQSDGFYRAFSPETDEGEEETGGLTFYLFDAFIAVYELSPPSFALLPCIGP